MQPQLIEYARDFGVIIITSFDKREPAFQCQCVQIFKANWQHVCHDFIQSNPSMTITKVPILWIVESGLG